MSTGWAGRVPKCGGPLPGGRAATWLQKVHSGNEAQTSITLSCVVPGHRCLASPGQWCVLSPCQVPGEGSSPHSLGEQPHSPGVPKGSGQMEPEMGQARQGCCSSSKKYLLGLKSGWRGADQHRGDSPLGSGPLPGFVGRGGALASG